LATGVFPAATRGAPDDDAQFPGALRETGGGDPIATARQIPSPAQPARRQTSLAVATVSGSTPICPVSVRGCSTSTAWRIWFRRRARAVAPASLRRPP